MHALPPRRLLALGIASGFALVIVVGAAAADARAGRGRPLRGVTVAGTDVGRMGPADLDRFLVHLEGEYRTMPVRLVATDGGFTATGADLGVTVDRASLRAEVNRAGRTGGGLGRLVSYLSSFVAHRHVDVPVSVDEAVVSATLSKADKAKRREPVDPKLVVRNARFQVVPGKAGLGIPTDAVAASIPPLARSGPRPLTVAVNRVVLPSRYTDEQVATLVDQATERTSRPLVVTVADRSASIAPSQLRTWVKPTIDNGRVRLTVDEDKALSGIRKAVGRVGTSPVDARLSIDANGTVTAVPAADGQQCCDPTTVTRIDEALASGSDNVTLDLQTIPPKITTDQIVDLGVKERISTFTTKHPPGEDRVKNIHHIADLLRGTVILPGQTFSVNDTIGPRSAANGFIKAHVIEDGVFAENYGGGISQFATTLFNAAFFGGMDLVEYQSHSLYISRYPYGREATLSFPHPDLKIRNITPYGIMIWPTYTERTLTVDLYSTRYVTGEVLDQRIEQRDQCKIVFTDRLRTFVDGRTQKDVTRAAYRPKEGIDCKGNPTAGATTTTLKPRPTTADRPSDTSPDTSESRPPTTREGSRTATTKAATEPPSATKPTPTEPAPERTTPPENGGVVARPPVTGVQ